MKSIISGRYFKYINPGLGYHGDQPGSPKQITHDGDTIKVFDAGNFGVRFLGVDTPESSYPLRDTGTSQFYKTDADEWISYLNNLEDRWPEMKQVVGEELSQNILNRLAGANAAENHHQMAEAAEDKLESIIMDDMQHFGYDKITMKFFLPFAYEIMDKFGRLLSFVNTHVENRDERRNDYNYRMLEAGATLPYFIWPNINPFRKEPSLVAALFENPGKFRENLEKDNTLQKARQLVKNARQNQLMLFQAGNKLILEAFELRYLGRKKAPSRWFINMNSGDYLLHHPLSYLHFLPEDRLFIPDHFVPLFESKGWYRSI